MTLEKRCRFLDIGEAVVERDRDRGGESFLYRWVNLKSRAGTEPAFSEGCFGEPIRCPEKNSVLEIADGEETYILTPPGLRILIRYEVIDKRNECLLVFPDGSNGLDLSRVRLTDRNGVRYFLGAGDITRGMRWYLPEGIDIGSRSGDWRLSTDRYGYGAVDWSTY